MSDATDSHDRDGNPWLSVVVAPSGLVIASGGQSVGFDMTPSAALAKADQLRPLVEAAIARARVDAGTEPGAPTPKRSETQADTSGRIACPWCLAPFDAGFYHWGSAHKQTVTCPACAKGVRLERRVTVDYSAVPEQLRTVELTPEEAALAARRQLHVLRRPLDPQPPSEEHMRAKGNSYSLSPAVSKAIQFYSLNDYARLSKEPGVFQVTGAVGMVRDFCGQAEWTCPLGVPGTVLSAPGVSLRIVKVCVESGNDGWSWAIAVEPLEVARG